MARLSFKNKKRKANNAKKQRGIKRKFGGGTAATDPNAIPNVGPITIQGEADAIVLPPPPPAVLPSSIYTTTKLANGESSIIEVQESTNHYSKLAEKLEKCNDDIGGISRALSISNDITDTLLHDVNMSQRVKEILKSIIEQRDKLISVESSNQLFQEQLQSLQHDSQSKQEKINQLDRNIKTITERHERVLDDMNSQYEKMVGDFNQRIFALKIETLEQLGKSHVNDNASENANYIKRIKEHKTKVEDEKEAHDILQKKFGELEEVHLSSQKTLEELRQKLVSERYSKEILEETKETIQQTLSERTKKISELEEKLSELEQNSEKKSQNIGDLKTNIDNQKSLNEKLQANIEQLHESIDKLSADKLDLESQKQTNAAVFESMKAKLERAKVNRDKKISELEGLIDETKQSHNEFIASLKKSYDETIKGQNEKFQTFMKEIEEKNKENSENISKIQELETDLELLKKSHESELQINECAYQKNIEQIQLENEHVRQQLEQAQSELGKTQTDLTQSQGELVKSQGELKKSQENLSSTQDELEKSQEELKAINEAKAILEQEKSRLHDRLVQSEKVATTTIENLKKRKEELSEKVKSLTEEKRNSDVKSAVRSTAISTVSEITRICLVNKHASDLKLLKEQITEKKRQLEEQITEKERQLTEQTEKSDSVEQENEALKKEKDDLDSLNKDLEKVVEILDQQLTQSKDQTKEAATELNLKKSIIKKLESAVTQLGEGNKSIQEENKKQRERIQTLERGLSTVVENLKAKIKENRQKNKDIKQLENKIGNYEKKIQELKTQNQQEIEAVKASLQREIELLKKEKQENDKQLKQQSQEIENAKTAFNKIEKEIARYNQQSGLQQQQQQAAESSETSPRKNSLLSNIGTLYKEAVKTYNSVIKKKNDIIKSLNLKIDHQSDMIQEQEDTISVMTEEYTKTQQDIENQNQLIEKYVSLIGEMKVKLSKVESETTVLTQVQEILELECDRLDGERVQLQNYHSDSESSNDEDDMISDRLDALYFRDLREKIQLLMKMFKERIDGYESKLKFQKRVQRFQGLFEKSKANLLYERLKKIHNKLKENNKSHIGKNPNNLLSNIEEELSKDKSDVQGYIHYLKPVNLDTVNTIDDFLPEIQKILIDEYVSKEDKINEEQLNFYKALLRSVGLTEHSTTQHNGGGNGTENTQVGTTHKIMKILTNLLLTYSKEYNTIKNHVLIKRYENVLTNQKHKSEDSYGEPIKNLKRIYKNIKTYDIVHGDFVKIMNELVGLEGNIGLHVFQDGTSSSSETYGYMMKNCIKYFKDFHDKKHTQSQSEPSQNMEIDIDLMNKVFFIYVSYRINELNFSKRGVNIEKEKLKPDLRFILFMIETIKYLRYIINLNLHGNAEKPTLPALKNLETNEKLLSFLNEYRHSDVISYVKIRDSSGDPEKVHPFNPNFLFYIDEELKDQPQKAYDTKSLSLFYSNTEGNEPFKINEGKSSKEGESSKPIYDNHASFGNFTKIMHNVSNEEYSTHMTEVKDKLEEGKNVCLIGYGCSGSGKTSTLIHFANNGVEEEGAVSQMLSKIKGLAKVKVTISEIFQDLIGSEMTSTSTTPISESPFEKELSKLFIDQYEESLGRNSKYKSNIVTLEKVKDVPFSKQVNGKLMCDNEVTWNPNVSEKFQSYKSQLFGESSIAPGTSLSAVLKRLITENRLQAPTPNNPQSSRSHVIVKIELTLSEPSKTSNLYICDFAGVENKFDYEIDLEAIANYLKKVDVDMDKAAIGTIDDIDNTIVDLYKNSSIKGASKKEQPKQFKELIPDGMLVLMNVLKETSNDSDKTLSSIIQHDVMSKIGKGIVKKVYELNQKYYGKDNTQKNPNYQSIKDCYEKLLSSDSTEIKPVKPIYPEGFNLIVANKMKGDIGFHLNGHPNMKTFATNISAIVSYDYSDKMNVTFNLGEISFIISEETTIVGMSPKLPKAIIIKIIEIIKNHNKIIKQNEEEKKQQQAKNDKTTSFRLQIFMRIHYLHMILVTRSYEGMFINNSLTSLRHSITKQLKKANGNDVPLIPDFDEKCIQQYCDPIMGKCFNELDPNELTMNESNKRQITGMTEKDPFEVSLSNYQDMTFCICLMINNSYWENGNYFNNPVSIPYINLEQGYNELERLKRFIYNRAIPANWKSNEDIQKGEISTTSSESVVDSIDKFYFYARNLVLSDKNLDKKSIETNSGDIRKLQGINAADSSVEELKNVRKKGINIDIIDKIYNYANSYYSKTQGVSDLFRKQLEHKYSMIKGIITEDSTYRDVAFLSQFLEMIKTMNSTSVVGTLDFTDEVSKYNLQYNKCSIMAGKDTDTALVTWSNNGQNILHKTPLLTTSSSIPKAQEYIKKYILVNGEKVNFKEHNVLAKPSMGTPPGSAATNSRSSPTVQSEIKRIEANVSKQNPQTVSSARAEVERLKYGSKQLENMMTTLTNPSFKVNERNIKSPTNTLTNTSTKKKGERKVRRSRIGGAKTKKYKLRNKGKKKFRKTKKN